MRRHVHRNSTLPLQRHESERAYYCRHRARAATLLDHRLLLKAAVNDMPAATIVRDRSSERRNARRADFAAWSPPDEENAPSASAPASFFPSPPAIGKISRAAAGLLERTSNRQPSVFVYIVTGGNLNAASGSLLSAVRALCSPAERAKSDLRALNGIPGSTVTLELSRSSRRNPFISATPFASDS